MIRTDTRRWPARAFVAIGLLALTTACVLRPGRAGEGRTQGDSVGATGTPAAAPRLTRVTPDTIRLGKGEAPGLTLFGSGFVPGSTGTFAVGTNIVRIGPASFDMLPADSAGTTIRFTMSLTYPDTARRGRPSVFAPGTFAVSVVTPSGTSNALSLTMIP